MEDLEGRTAVVTGAAHGIGEALCRHLARAGARVVASDIDEAGLGTLVESLRSSGAPAIGVAGDVSQPEDNEALAAAADDFGPAHLVFLNAGVNVIPDRGGDRLIDLGLADWEWVLGVNLWGPVHGTRAFLPRLLAAGEGRLVYTASIASLVPGHNPYSVSKYGVDALASAVRTYLAGVETRVGVTIVYPSRVVSAIAFSALRRPTRWGGSDDPAAAEAARVRDEELAGMDRMDPADAADAILAGVVAGRYAIVTDPAALPRIRQSLERRWAELVEGSAEAALDLGVPGRG